MAIRFWLIGLPGGIGYATLKAILKLWLGFKPEHSGIFSAGNGPAMRSAIIGVCYGNDSQKLRELVIASTRLTHWPKNGIWSFSCSDRCILIQSAIKCYSPKILFYSPKLHHLSSFLKLINQACNSVDSYYIPNRLLLKWNLAGALVAIFITPTSIYSYLVEY